MLFTLFISTTLWAFSPEKVFTAAHKKNDFYIQDGVFIGGDASIQESSIQTLRHFSHPTFERMVMDVTSLHPTLGTQKPPYFQVALDKKNRTLTLTLWGNTTDTLNKKTLELAFQSSTLWSQMTLVPKLDSERWMLEGDFKTPTTIEVFELHDPSRIVIDIKTTSTR